mgnify:CR=1 FL=1
MQLRGLPFLFAGSGEDVSGAGKDSCGTMEEAVGRRHRISAIPQERKTHPES